MLIRALRTASGRGAAGRRPSSIQRRLRLEFLEERAVPSRTWTVDDDGQQFKTADFTSIQAAVNAPAPGDRIEVFAGTYQEQVTVTKNNLDIFAAGALGQKGGQGDDDDRGGNGRNGHGGNNGGAIIEAPATLTGNKA